jgi:hypothetical protein
MQAIATRKAIRRLIPLLGICFFISIIDRTNVSVASLTMNADIGLSAAAYGFGAGIFFIGYFLFEVPSNLALAKYGARRWIARIMITWGLISVGMYFINNETTFYIFRFLLGAAEAGFFPGVVFFLYQWFDQKNIAKVLATFFAFGPLANAVGAPLATAIMNTWGWQWVFVVEGIPAIILAFVVLRVLPDSIEDAKWLTTDEKLALRSAVAKPQQHVPWMKALKDPQTILMCSDVCPVFPDHDQQLCARSMATAGHQVPGRRRWPDGLAHRHPLRRGGHRNDSLGQTLIAHWRTGLAHGHPVHCSLRCLRHRSVHQRTDPGDGPPERGSHRCLCGT